ncbi:MAG TPA: type VI secretion system ImpA family N-terminal domain-containing protein, partial [Paracoccaceae bacterium]|nr:type VI secretion system ImpA family N-terminal domain-containing protein [Paracoccaceae bacterium]
QPCGPDLDMEFDMDFMTFSAEIDGAIPTRYFDWDSSTLDFRKYYDQIAEFLQKTRDIRLLVPLAKLRILQSDLAGFAETVDAMHRLLRERWSDCHPQPAEFLDLGMGQLATLDDMPNVVLPLQHATLAQSRRAGPITLRKWQVAHGEVNPRAGEDVIDLDTLSGALAEADKDELGRMRDILVRARDAIAGIRTVCMQEAGFDKAPPIERLPQALAAAIAMVETVTGSADAGADPDAPADAADGSAGPASGAVTVRLPAGAVANREKAVEAMHVAERYFALKEPSSPVPVLLREAQAASGKSFYELVNEFLPDNASAAAVALGKDVWFDIHLSTLDARNPAPDYLTEESGPAAAEDAGLGDDEIGEGVAEMADHPSEDGTTPDGSGPEESPPQAGESGDEPADSERGIAPDPAAPAIAGPNFVAGSRSEAVALLEKVLAYYRVAEPTSPVPLFVERAIELSSKSFIELLGNVMPEGALKAKKG